MKKLVMCLMLLSLGALTLAGCEKKPAQPAGGGAPPAAPAAHAPAVEAPAAHTPGAETAPPADKAPN